MPTEFPSARAGLEGALQPDAFPMPEKPKDPDLDAADRISGLDALELGPKKDKGAFGRRAWSATWPKLLAIAIVIGIWQLVYLSEWRPAYVFPAPLDVFTELGELVTEPKFWDGVRLTMTRAITGFALAVAIGTLIGAAVSRFTPLRAAIGSLITGLQTMPSIMWFPLAILLFQLGEEAILFVVVIGAAPSVANGLISGIDYVPRTWLRVGQVMGMKGLAKYRHLILPASLPSFVSGLKQGWAFSWRSLMAGELLVIVPGTVSIGVRMQTARDLNDAVSVLAYIIVVLVIGILVDQFFNTADRALRKRWGLTGS
ncbi:ABC transporter permease [Actinoplanes derwentensis]|uniref:NitT/TauT family transport system permease protein n=1 Tax=Actinoplanes derwentensis TaxID=113562 RepID=A0A1H2D2I4_9ACTN|nr:ABC transporter permease [Actinoplanes derwentensis]GID86851.1 sulfate ABC transporter permease [Actinoplanes derwentensis]SDT76794.1 NitT/TauT family transport system permease protein [Actinoplanes derwentensis]